LKRKYIPDLAQEAAVCEGNYLKLARILPELDNMEHCSLKLHSGAHSLGRVHFQVVERFTYTLTLLVVHEHPHLPGSVNRSEVLVRVYDDAGMAEVVSCARGRQLEGVYSYPNNKMLQVDEKAQSNKFLSECLSHCLEHGIAAGYQLEFDDQEDRSQSPERM